MQSCSDQAQLSDSLANAQMPIYNKQNYTCADSGTPPYTQTEAYLRVPSLNNLVQKWYNEGELSESDKKSDIYDSYKSIRTSYKEYAPIINLALAREKEYANDFVFYHAFSSELRIIQDLLKALYELEHKSKVDNFEFLRSYKSTSYKNLPPLEQWLDETSEKYGRVHDYDQIAYMLSTNVTFFGNITRNNSNTFKYFIKSFSAKPPPLGFIFDEILSQFIVSAEQRAHINSILQLSKELINTKEGNILQIFIPRNIVNQVAYLSIARGYVYKHPILENIFSTKKSRHQCISAILDYLRSEPNDLGDIIDNFEARIIPRHEFFANPNSGIKIFRYSTLTPEAEKIYLEIIQKIANFIYDNRTAVAAGDHDNQLY